jgi:hypothetical protein
MATAGCREYILVCSLNPFYVEKNMVLEKAVEGKWQANSFDYSKGGKKDAPSIWLKSDTSLIWEIERKIEMSVYKDKKGNDSATVANPQKYYLVKLLNPENDSTISQFKMVLFTVKGNLYADIVPVGNVITDSSRLGKENYTPVHTLARINYQGTGTGIVISWLCEETMRKMIEDKRVRVKYTYNKEPERILLTGTSVKLTEMIERYAGQKRFIDWDDQQAMMKLIPLNR